MAGRHKRRIIALEAQVRGLVAENTQLKSHMPQFDVDELDVCVDGLGATMGIIEKLDDEIVILKAENKKLGKDAKPVKKPRKSKKVKKGD